MKTHRHNWLILAYVDTYLMYFQPSF